MTKPKSPEQQKTGNSMAIPDTIPPAMWDSILRERAKVLAQPLQEEQTEETIEVVTLQLAYETYAVETAYVREVYPLKDLTPLPCTPPFVAGIVNVRGQVMSVIDLKKLFDLPAKGITDLNKVVILGDGDMEFGILADAILDVRDIPLQGFQTRLPTLTGIREDCLKGITPERIVVLDAARMLHHDGIVVHEEVT